MNTFFRNISANLVAGVQDTLAGTRNSLMSDVSQDTLVIYTDKSSQAEMTLSAGETATIPLPVDYANTELLTVFIATKGDVTITTTSPSHTTSKIYSESEDWVINYFQDKFNSITVLENSGTEIASVKYGSWVESTTVRGI